MIDEKTIKTGRGIFGRVNITLPISIKESMLDLQKNSGMKKAEFFRTALMMGTVKLSEDVLVRKMSERLQLSQQPARR
jgi:hypothetical protein